MKVVLNSLVLLTLSLAAAYGDELRLRDGKTVTGYYVGGNQKELWFQSNAVGADVYPTFVVENLQFGTVSGTIPLGYSKPAPGAPTRLAALPHGNLAPQQGNLGWFARAKLYLTQLYVTTILMAGLLGA